MSIHQKVRNAGFVQTDTHNYKYTWLHKLYHVGSSLRATAKNHIGTIRSKFDLLYGSIDWSIVWADLSKWSVEVILEGISVNFMTHILFGMDFTIATIIAHGILIKQGIDIYWRLRLHGATTKIPHKRK